MAIAKNPRPKTPTQIKRKKNLLFLIGDEHGDIATFAKAHNVSPAYLWQIKNTDRGVGEEIARKIERSIGLDLGWLDQASAGNPDDAIDFFALKIAKEAKIREVPAAMQETILYLLKMAPEKADKQ